MSSPGAAAPPQPWTLFAAGSSGDGGADARSRPDRPRKASSTPGDRSGTVLGQFELIRRLGRGGMGEVYESFYRADRRRYALKILIADERRDPLSETRFRHEFLALRQAEVPGLVRAHALYEIDGELFYSMELLEGRDLEALIKEEPLPPARVLEIGVALTRTIEGLHERGIIHRDIKPTNIIELDDGELRLVDLGIGKLLPPFYAASGEGRTPPEERLTTRPGVWLGTPGYIAPEAGFGEAPAPRQDVFSLGVTLFRLATRHFPFPQAATPGALAEPRAGADLGVELPAALEAVLRRAMILEPTHRLQTMVALRAELEDALAELRADDVEVQEASKQVGHRRPPSDRARANVRAAVFLAALCVVTTAIGVLLGVSVAGSGDRRVLPLAIEIGRALSGGASEEAREEAPASQSAGTPADVSEVAGSTALADTTELGDAVTGRDPGAPSSAGPAPVAAEEAEATTRRDATAPSRAPKPRPAMREALRTADARLRRCTARGEGSVFIEFVVDAEGTSFASATPIYETDPELVRCVQRVTASLRFTPTPRQIFVEEYSP